uniref:Uncharacterized protein n=1 Tax=Arundo donax TaxID=35708 RepID=A0A0A9FAR1_ARUDO
MEYKTLSILSQIDKTTCFTSAWMWNCGS